METEQWDAFLASLPASTIRKKDLIAHFGESYGNQLYGWVKAHPMGNGVSRHRLYLRHPDGMITCGNCGTRGSAVFGEGMHVSRRVQLERGPDPLTYVTCDACHEDMRGQMNQYSQLVWGECEPEVI